MDDLRQRMAELSPEKRALLELFLQEQQADGVWQQRDYSAPQGAVEIALADIWRQALRVERVGRQDNFFEMGGDSLHCIQIVAKARETGLHLTTNQLFAHPTIAELAQVIESAGERNRAVTPSLPQTVAPGEFPEAELSPVELERLLAS
ncbi:MAG: phosphopantetheine-binding protein [Acidobacteria bacterium]|nr:phosphopantetheine-binding protein [Acidobacteriota bacterium]